MSGKRARSAVIEACRMTDWGEDWSEVGRVDLTARPRAGEVAELFRFIEDRPAADEGRAPRIRIRYE